MLKELFIPKKSTYTLTIPTHYIGKRVEVLLYSVDELSENKEPNKKKPSDFFGTLSLPEGEEFQKYVTNSRLEWERNI